MAYTSRFGWGYSRGTASVSDFFFLFLFFFYSFIRSFQITCTQEVNEMWSGLGYYRYDFFVLLWYYVKNYVFGVGNILLCCRQFVLFSE